MGINRYKRGNNKEIDKVLGVKLGKGIKWKIAVTVIVTSTATLGAYWTIGTTNNKFISKYRTLYIETALSTMNHQWLATKLLPYETVNKVRETMQRGIENSIVERSRKPRPSAKTTYQKLMETEEIEVGYSKEEIDIMNFKLDFPDINIDTIPRDMDISSIDISDACELGIETIYGERVWALNTSEKIVIIEVKGNNFVGKLCLIGGPQRIKVATNGQRGYGKTVLQMCEDTGAILGINAGGFSDYNGMGNGGLPIGIVKSDGEVVHRTKASSYFQYGGLDYEDNFLVGRGYDIEEFRDAVEFYPAVIVDGKENLDSNFGMGIQPRTIVGQTVDRRIVMLAIDGRRPGYSIGATVKECSEILTRYNTWSALNMDGGASTALVYKGETINKVSNGSQNGRGLPNAWVVLPLENNGGKHGE